MSENLRQTTARHSAGVEQIMPSGQRKAAEKLSRTASWVAALERLEATLGGVRHISPIELVAGAEYV